MLWWILFVVFAIYFYVRVLLPHRYWKDKGISHLKPWPIFGNMAQSTFRLKPFAFNIEDIYKACGERRYIGFYQFLQPSIMLKDIDLIKQIAIKDFDSFLDHRTFIDENLDPLFGKNLFSLKGQKWRDMRSTLSPAFTSSKMRSMFILISDCAEQFANHFLEKSKQEKAAVTVEMKDLFTRFSNDVIATSAFGIKCDSLKERDNEFYIMGKDASNFGGIRSLKFFGYTISPMLMKLFQFKIFNDSVCDFFRGLVKTTMLTREKQGIVRPDMIHLLMEAKKGKLKHDESKQKDDDAGFATVEESNVGKQTGNYAAELTDDDITAQALLFFIAGFDTISGLMCHTAHELAINPDIQKRLQDEVDTTYDECGGKLTYDAVMSMKYLDMVISEALRKWPAAIMTDRLCTKPYTIPPVNADEKPLHLVKGDVLLLPIWALHHDPEHYPDPERFDPERFSDENKDSIKPYAYIPFGAGPRNCIGSRFALLEAKAIFINILRKFDIVVNEKTQIPLKLSKSQFNLNAENGFWLGLKPRTSEL